MKEIGPIGAHRVAASVVEQITPLLPPDVTVTVADDPWPRLRLAADRPGWAIFDFGLLGERHPDETVEGRLAGVMTTFLDFVQDFLVQHTGTPWPGTGTTLPLPSVVVGPDSLEGRYGTAPAVVRMFLVDLVR